jgi:formylmethanofuran dehydrogenase subunit E
MVLIEDNVWVCPSCFKNYARCSVCGEYHLKADMTETSEDTYICDECKAEEEEFEEAV